MYSLRSAEGNRAGRLIAGKSLPQLPVDFAKIDGDATSAQNVKMPQAAANPNQLPRRDRRPSGKEIEWPTNPAR